ncbi:hypothetical protein EGN72_07505 [Pseudorhodobacter sp. E13]|uniref:hypothetical protein n=1 Tax=Pseudorhodobacter sp. E13 TaxID=2487931 RepID=UPI000F8CA768|nr:hypothetical protein [Pseudorhodobacter sp. E13]RUS60741.1 hypothetical protein EGN72_07505 [Pseudorhodobacter sp. E13]
MTDAFRDLLLPGERLLWTARPVPWAGLTPGGVVQLVVGLGAPETPRLSDFDAAVTLLRSRSGAAHG